MAKIVSGNSALDLKKSADNIFRKIYAHFR